MYFVSYAIIVDTMIINVFVILFRTPAVCHYDCTCEIYSAEEPYPEINSILGICKILGIKDGH